MTDGTRFGRALEMALPHPLPGHLDEAQIGDRERLGARAVAAKVLAKLLEHLVAIRLGVHVDEVADDDAADVAQPQLTRDLSRGFHVRLEAVFSGSFLPTKRPELTSMEMSASVGSMMR